MKEQEVKDAVVATEATKKEVKQYEYAHLVMYCGKCNARYILEENLSKGQGVNINLPLTSDAEIILVCKECGNKMGLFYVESNKKSEDNAETVQVEEVKNDKPAKKESRKK